MAIGTTAALVGGSVLSGAMASSSANRASDAQTDAANDATELQREIYYNDIDRAQPFYDSGVNALAAYNYELGLGPRPGMVAANTPATPGQTNALAQPAQQAMTPGPFGVDLPEGFRAQGTNEAGTWRLIGPNGTADVSDVQSMRMALMAMGAPQAMPQQATTEAAAATAAPGQGFEYRGFQETPGFRFAVGEAESAINANAAATGRRFSGATLNALQNNRLGMANQEYGTWLNRVGGQAGQGAQITGQIANLGQNFGAQAGQNMLNAGNARASGYMGQNNAFQGMLGNFANIFGMQQAGMFRGGGMPNAFAANPLSGGGLY
jgi:hypothetical protein